MGCFLSQESVCHFGKNSQFGKKSFRNQSFRKMGLAMRSVETKFTGFPILPLTIIKKLAFVYQSITFTDVKLNYGPGHSAPTLLKEKLSDLAQAQDYV